MRPDSIYVHLYANGVDTGVIAKLNESNHWSYIFGDLDVYKNGKKINYSLVEENVKGYVGSVSGDSEVGFVLTNTHTPKDSEEIYTRTKMYMVLSRAALGCLYILLKKRKEDEVR